MSAEIARPFAELRWMGALPGTSRAKRRWRNQRISLTSGEERVPGGEALTAVYLSHRVSAGPYDGPNQVSHRRTRGRIRFLR